MKHEGTTQKSPVPRPKWPEIIRQKRKNLGETQAEFGKRFKFSQVAVSDWERGVSEPPAVVTYWLYTEGVVDEPTAKRD